MAYYYYSTFYYELKNYRYARCFNRYTRQNIKHHANNGLVFFEHYRLKTFEHTQYFGSASDGAVDTLNINRNWIRLRS